MAFFAVSPEALPLCCPLYWIAEQKESAVERALLTDVQERIWVFPVWPCFFCSRRCWKTFCQYFLLVFLVLCMYLVFWGGSPSFDSWSLYIGINDNILGGSLYWGLVWYCLLAYIRFFCFFYVSLLVNIEHLIVHTMHTMSMWIVTWFWSHKLAFCL